MNDLFESYYFYDFGFILKFESGTRKIRPDDREKGIFGEFS